jgi:hypothetical protein
MVGTTLHRDVSRGPSHYYLGYANVHLGRRARERRQGSPDSLGPAFGREGTGPG